MEITYTMRQIFGLRKQKGLVGVELELEGANLPQLIQNWDSHLENSLRGENREYVSQGAVSLDQLKSNLSLMKEAFSVNKTKVFDAYRGSVHVHVNVQEKTFPQIFTTLFVWLLTEQLWLKLCGPTRDGNLFCLTSSTSNDIIPYCRSVFSRFLYGPNFRFPERGKYSSLNTDCLSRFGSLEFRTFPSSSEPDKVLEWATWSTKLVEYGTSLDPNSLAKVWEEALHNPRKFYGKFFGDSINNIDDFELFIFAEQGADYASDLLLVWEEYKANLSKRNQPSKAGIPNNPNFGQLIIDEFHGNDLNDLPIEDDEDEDEDNDEEEEGDF